MQPTRTITRAWKLHRKPAIMATAPIAGPRRARSPVLVATAPRSTPPPLPQAAMPGHAPVAPLPPPPARPLPPLDYDQSGALKPQDEPTQPGRRHKVHRVRWFVLGIAVGAVVAVFASGDARATFDAARAWGAHTLRSLERCPARAPHASGAAPSAMATAAEARWPKSAWEPCPVEPSGEDPCAELLAPFAGDPWMAGSSPPLVSVDDLPRAKAPAPVVVAVARRHPRPAAPAAPAASQAPSEAPSGDDPETAAETPAGINPETDDPQASPTRVTPRASPPPAPVERPVPEPPPAKVSIARDEPT
jgi:hypothetical protein